MKPNFFSNTGSLLDVVAGLNKAPIGRKKQTIVVPRLLILVNEFDAVIAFTPGSRRWLLNRFVVVVVVACIVPPMY